MHEHELIFPASVSNDLGAMAAHADTCFAAGRHHEAIADYQRVLAEQPHNVHALHRLGLALFCVDRPDRSREHFDQALNVAPERADIWEHRGLIAALDGELIAAEAFYHRAVGLGGGTVSLHRNLGDCLKLSKRLVEARGHYLKALELEPTLHHAVRSLARVSTELERYQDAADYWLRAWALDPTHLPDALDLITALSRAQRGEGIDSVLAELRIRFAADASALQQVAFALNDAERFSDAISVAIEALGVDPRNGWLHHNASFAFNMLGDFPAMHVHAVEAARLMPDHPLMQFNLAAAQLRAGDYENGWKQYRWHEALPENHDLVRPAYPEWQGERVTGRRFLLVGEQGLGDQLQFLCMADWLNKRGAQVDVWVEAPLGEVARSAAGVRAAWTTAPPGPYDYWCRMLSMPEPMKLALPMLPLSTSYLRAEPAQVQRWRSRLDAFCATDARDAPRKRVGIVWAGNPAYELDRYRSIPLRQWLPVLQQTGVHWFALQKGETQNEAVASRADIGMHALDPEIDTFADTLAIVQSLDLVITVDTAVAHLAGACGTPVWVLVPTFTDWRWLTERDDSPWYPSARLFRQRELGRWDTVLDEVARALRDFVAG
ncbi:tetratricopeptide repeat protein [Paraburkholderia sp. BL18I3N2]|uniref:tetratricopeptide repeat-containing glycosyltransferase family protein n=1 Tax=Paraburkholderia sp. BL18I3N2 TaxID=1938799 RepID=UPI000D057C84|nr:tetratricopeptide repeat-containing glycosyltransferase family protein [Paraburkholderia sp. BL18I3N2]PRX32294.1 tetratricopeptide repeat protein [Paraburkholderia sp. BL18I3N2]